MEKFYNKITKVGKWMDRGIIRRTIDNINNDPECGWTFLTTILLLGGFGVILCLIWFYLMIKQGIPTWAIIFDSAIIVFCIWAVFKCIVPNAKKCYKDIEKKKQEANNYESK